MQISLGNFYEVFAASFNHSSDLKLFSFGTCCALYTSFCLIDEDTELQF
jgi:hypothetical protein